MRIIKLFSIGKISAHAPLIWAGTRDNALAYYKGTIDESFDKQGTSGPPGGGGPPPPPPGS